MSFTAWHLEIHIRRLEQRIEEIANSIAAGVGTVTPAQLAAVQGEVDALELHVEDNKNKSGTGSPEGAVVGVYVGQTYHELGGDGSTVAVWTFQGTPGQNTGWQGPL